MKTMRRFLGASQVRNRGGSSSKHVGFGAKLTRGHFGMGLKRSTVCEKGGCDLPADRGAYCEHHGKLFYRLPGD